MAITTKPIRELLERHNIVPTGDAKKDMKAAKKVMKPFHDKLKRKYYA